ncbi:adenylate/guanylate cyclase domain-containing protein [Methanosarcina sp. Z-7115]|uniref:Adenylate/guanylate cyclase domain-containing protein n=1 Tax=Methanosarcina baikalica TaxID=3073890 RepID=A0ABU2D387_9EURY|nr:adenylate/guanylate cyclase domain-containing protein [Methanosarcina sp. Z-7115]MDR7666428.1 adenylate/guanylate cyclase domain-containing protein [Methanosarcina sp. Z-7115]
MKSNYINYDYLKSFDRIDNIIKNSYNYEELNYIPSRDKLTYSNGFYVNCSAMFVDIRGSSKLPDIHRRPKLAKLYRAYVSEVVSVMNGNPCCIEVNIVGDCVSGIFDTKTKPIIDLVFSTAAQISSLIDVMNHKFKKNDIETIEVGIGISYGRALMVKAGYDGSGINDVVWMGDVVNEAANLCSCGNKELYDLRIMVSESIYINLNEDNKELLCKNNNRGCYHGSVVASNMNEWYRENCK